MKLVIAIVQDEDASQLLSQMMTEGFSVTKLATTGGFLRAGNTTILLGTEDDRVPVALKVIENVCRSRKQVSAPHGTMMDHQVGNGYTGFPMEVTVGGATVFVLTVDQFLKV